MILLQSECRITCLQARHTASCLCIGCFRFVLQVLHLSAMLLSLHHSFSPLKRFNVQLESTNHSLSRLTGTSISLHFCNTAIYQSVFCCLSGCLVFARSLQCGTSGTHVCFAVRQPVCVFCFGSDLLIEHRASCNCRGYQYCVSATRSTAIGYLQLLVGELMMSSVQVSTDGRPPSCDIVKVQTH